MNSEHDIPEHAHFRHYINERLQLSLAGDDSTVTANPGDATAVVYHLRACVYAIEDEDGGGAHTIAYCRHRGYKRTTLVDDHVDYEWTDSQNCWLMYNDCTVVRVTPDEVLRYDPTWKLPLLLCYEREEWPKRVQEMGMLQVDCVPVHTQQSCRHTTSSTKACSTATSV
jgi:hypothetical protein